MKKIIFVLLVAVMMLQTSLVCAKEVEGGIGTVETQGWIELCWENTSSIMVMIKEGNSSVEVGLYIGADDGAPIRGNLYLEKYSGGSWQTVRSWRIAGRGSLTTSELWNVSSGKYRARVRATIGKDYVNETSRVCYVD